jgi:hypothetical protein
MRKKQFDRNGMARWYARQHLKTDPGIQVVYYLPEDAPEREIRLLEINDLIVGTKIRLSRSTLASIPVVQQLTL